jgi:hypothetical protein
MGTISDSSFPARLTTATDMLNNTATNLNQQYTLQVSNSAALADQNESIQSEVASLRAKLASVNMASDTYDREFTDRTSIAAPRTFFQRIGITTFQDWMILMFYISYAILSLGFIVAAILASQQKALAGISSLVLSIMVGMLITGIILRFS